MEKILIDAKYPEETRVAIINDSNELLKYEVELVTRASIRSNIYMAQVERIETSMQAAFINYGSDKHGFLSFAEIRDTLFPDLGEREMACERLKVGQRFLVQAIKDQRGNKCAAFTTFISVPSRYCILIPYATKQRIISRQIDMEDRPRLEEMLNNIKIPDGIGCILRTSGQDRTESEIKKDFEYLLRIWKEIEPTLDGAKNGLIYEDGDIVKRTLRDLYNKNTKSVIIQGAKAYQRARKFMKIFAPSHVKNLIEHKDEDVDIFNTYDINNKSLSMLQKTIQLPSGGSIVIEQTEALTSIDVNSGKMRTEIDTDATAIATNMEACEVIVKQIMLRDISGIIVVDFIDMLNKVYTTQVEQKMTSLFKEDFANVKLSKISQFGLMEISRQRLRASMVDINFIPCYHCGGRGKILNYNTVCMFAIRQIEEFLKENSGIASVVVEMMSGADLYILNHKKESIMGLEEKYGSKIIINTGDQKDPLEFRISIKASKVEDIGLEKTGATTFSAQQAEVYKPGIQGQENNRYHAKTRYHNHKNHSHHVDNDEAMDYDTQDSDSSDILERCNKDTAEDVVQNFAIQSISQTQTTRNYKRKNISKRIAKRNTTSQSNTDDSNASQDGDSN